MSKMSEIAMRLDELEVMVFDRGLGDAEVQAEASILCEIGFIDEVRAIFYEYEQMVYESSEY
jgi:hypothetical protein